MTRKTGLEPDLVRVIIIRRTFSDVQQVFRNFPPISGTASQLLPQVSLVNKNSGS